MTQTPSATFALADAVELVHVVRNGFVESRTPGAAVVTGPDGTVLAALGPVDALIYPRSTLKPFQAIASLRHGARLEGEEVAIACGSHRGTAAHRELAARILAEAGLSAADLQCPPDYPADAAEIVRFAQDLEHGAEATFPMPRASAVRDSTAAGAPQPSVPVWATGSPQYSSMTRSTSACSG